MTRSNGESIRAGATLARYRIIERIGAGGMGEVYRARDVDLERDVAVKVLPPDLVGSEERVRRFVQEAKAASGLNHPNIVVIYEIGTAQIGTAQLDGAKQHFIAMELIEGETLRAKIHKPHRDLKQLLGYAAQAADALAKAHAAGIVHRDLKPDNVMVTRDGFTKVLDFGLAKLTEPRESASADDATQVRPDTADGVVLGTVGYMSPEQAQGLDVDARSDIFSFGCILYEIATKERPFKGASQIDVLHAVVHDDPKPVTDINPNVPAELRRIIRRCLAKDPDQRIQSMKDLANTLRDLVDEYDQLTPGSGSTTRVTAIPAAKRVWPWIALAAAIVAVSIAAVALWRRDRPAMPTPLAQMKIAQLTTDGKAYEAAISPDGRYIAYALSDRSDSGIRVRQVATSSEIIARPQTDVVFYHGITFSRDGEHLFAIQTPRGSSIRSLVTLPTLGGEPRKVAHDADTRPAISPDGKSLAFIRYQAAELSWIIVADANGANLRTIATVKPPERLGNVAWSPDGKWIAGSLRTSVAGLQSRIDLFSPDGKERRRMTTDRWFDIGSFAWLPDMSGIVATAQKTERGIYQVWQISWPEGAGTQITNDLSSYNGVSVAADGKSMITLRGESRPRIWRVDFATGETTPVTDERAAHVRAQIAVARGGSFVYGSFEGGTLDIWSMHADGTSPRQLTTEPSAEFAPVIPASGDVIYYQREDERGLELWSMDLDGSSRRRIAALPPNDAYMDVSPDGRFVVFPTGKDLLVINTADGSSRALVKTGALDATYSPDGTKIAFMSRDPKRRVNVIVDARSGAVLHELPRGERQSPVQLEWSPDGNNLIVKEWNDGMDNIWLLPIDGSPKRQLSRLTQVGTGLNGVEPSPDGKAFFVGQYSDAQNVVLISNWK